MRPHTSAAVSSDTPAVVDQPRRALVVGHPLGADVSGLTLDVGQTLVIEPRPDGSLGEVGGSEFDIAVVAVSTHDLTGTATSLHAAGQLLKVDGRLALALSGSVNEPDPGRWSTAFREFTMQRFERAETGLLMWLEPSERDDLGTGPLALGALMAEVDGPSASMDQARAFTTEIAGHAEILGAEVTRLRGDNELLAAQLSTLERSRPVRWAARFRQARSKGVTGLRGRQLAAAVARDRRCCSCVCCAVHRARLALGQLGHRTGIDRISRGPGRDRRQG